MGQQYLKDKALRVMRAGSSVVIQYRQNLCELVVKLWGLVCAGRKWLEGSVCGGDDLQLATIHGLIVIINARHRARKSFEVRRKTTSSFGELGEWLKPPSC